jgi:hypothetical protein
MEKFMLIFHNTSNTEMAFQDQSPEELQAEIQKWNVWIGGLAAQGKMLVTEGLLPTGKVLSGSAKTVTDGPYTEGKEMVGGFMLLHADSYDEAVEHAQGCPVFGTQGIVEIRQVQNFG